MQLCDVTNEVMEWISTAPTSIIGNRRVLNFVILSFEIISNESLSELCNILEMLIYYPALLKPVRSLRNGIVAVNNYVVISHLISKGNNRAIYLIFPFPQGYYNDIVFSTGHYNDISQESATLFV